MNLGASEAVRSIAKRLKLFIQEIVIPHENAYEEELESDRWQIPNVMTELQNRAKSAGLFSLFIEKEEQTFSQVDYAHLAE